uniref:Uncharacterized protein n=1 Tax=Sphaerodactylus townsendi TaxID=933632 RepID=A0ACB8EEG9_9SAUR
MHTHNKFQAHDLSEIFCFEKVKARKKLSAPLAQRPGITSFQTTAHAETEQVGSSARKLFSRIRSDQSDLLKPGAAELLITEDKSAQGSDQRLSRIPLTRADNPAVPLDRDRVHNPTVHTEQALAATGQDHSTESRSGPTGTLVSGGVLLMARSLRTDSFRKLGTIPPTVRNTVFHPTAEAASSQDGTCLVRHRHTQGGNRELQDRHELVHLVSLP